MTVTSLAIVGHAGPALSRETMTAAHALAALAALGQPTRLDILRLLVRKEPKGLPAGEIAEAVGCPHNTLSTHIAILARAGLVQGRRDGRSIIYRAKAEGIRAFIGFLVNDCCDGRPEMCGLASDSACGSVPTRKKGRRK